MTTADVPQYPPLGEDAPANVCVVGAGIAGLTTAYLAAREGKSVIVLDDGPIGGGESGRTTAHLSNAFDDRYTEVERMHGEKGARLVAESHTAAIDEIERIVSAEGIECDFSRVDGYLFDTPGTAASLLEDELGACHRAGLHEVRLVPRVPVDTFNSGPALHFPRQAQFHPLKYLAGLARAIEKHGGRIHTRSHVDQVKGGQEHATVTVHGGRTVLANAVVVATNTPVNDWISLHTKQAAYRTYVIGALVPAGRIPTALYWDTADPYHYVRLHAFSPKHDLLLVGGEDHKTGHTEHTESCFDRLESWARAVFPVIEWVEFRWSGQVMEPADGVAFIGRDPAGEDNVYVVTGDSGNGMTHGTLAGILLTDLIGGRENEWAALYDPKRKPLRALGEYTKENLDVAKQFIDYVRGGDVHSAEAVGRGSGAVIRRGLQKIAVYRDEHGEAHEFSAVCPHLNCIVHWNPTEKTWDCPCHGSRFDCMGKVVNGPANQDLTPADDQEPEETVPAKAV